MRTLMILACVALAVLQGCSSAGTTTPASASAQPATGATNEVPSAGPSPTTRGTDAASADTTALRMVGLARQHLTTTLGVTPEQITLSSVEAVQWRDAGLGCPKPGVDYLEMPTPGFRITLMVAGAAYEYHADQASRVIQCGAGPT